MGVGAYGGVAHHGPVVPQEIVALVHGDGGVAERGERGERVVVQREARVLGHARPEAQRLVEDGEVHGEALRGGAAGQRACVRRAVRRTYVHVFEAQALAAGELRGGLLAHALEPRGVARELVQGPRHCVLRVVAAGDEEGDEEVARERGVGAREGVLEQRREEVVFGRGGGVRDAVADDLVDEFVQGGLCAVEARARAVPLQAEASVLRKRDARGVCRHSFSVNFQIGLNSRLVDGGVSETTGPGEGDAPGGDLVQDE